MKLILRVLVYTSGRIYNAMKTMYEFDTALREAFTKGAHKDGVVFIQKAKDGSIVPCAPNKILITSTTALNPHKELRLSAGFQTKAKTHIVKTIKEIDDILVQACKEKSNKEQPFRLSLAQALRICDLIDDTLEYGEKNNKGYEWVEKFKSVIEYLCKIADTEEVYCYVRRDRKISSTFGRKQTDEIYYSTFPDGGPDRLIAKEVAKKIPCLML